MRATCALNHLLVCFVSFSLLCCSLQPHPPLIGLFTPSKLSSFCFYVTCSFPFPFILSYFHIPNICVHIDPCICTHMCTYTCTDKHAHTCVHTHTYTHTTLTLHSEFERIHQTHGFACLDPQIVPLPFPVPFWLLILVSCLLSGLWDETAAFGLGVSFLLASSPLGRGSPL